MKHPAMLAGRHGFTLIELLITIAIIAVISSLIFVMVDPVQRFKDSRNSKRQQDVESILNAVRLYQVDNKGLLPEGIDNNWKMLGTSPTGCNISCSNIASSTNGNILQSSPFTFTNNTYTSNILTNSNSTTNWTNLSWITNSPYGKELPNNGQSESGYTSNANMTGNVLLLHLNETTAIHGSQIADSSGNGNNGVLYTNNGGTNKSVTGKLNTAIKFDGVDDGLDLGNNSNLKFGKNDYSVCAWVKRNTSGGYQVIFGDQENGGNWRGRFLRFQGGTIIFAAGNYDSTWVNNGSVLSLTQHNDLVWHFICGVLNGADNKTLLYINGVLDNSSFGSNTYNVNNNSNVYIGRKANGEYFNGIIDEISLFSRALSSAEISNMYLRGAARLKLQVRSCDDDSCSGESFVGPDNTNSTYFTEGSNLTPPSFTLNNHTNPYFQYQATFESDPTGITPNLQSVNIDYNQSETAIGDTLQSSCLDLSNALSSQFTKFPSDPSLGTPEKTYYAIKKEDNKLITVWSCGAEDEVIKISK